MNLRLSTVEINWLLQKLLQRNVHRLGQHILILLANERIMDDNRNELEPPLKVGSGKQVAESCVLQKPKRTDVNDEGATLNLPRSVTPDVQQVPTVLLKAKKITRISTFNLRTGKEDWRLHEVIHHMNPHKISIIGIQEHRRIHEEEEVKFQHVDKHLLATVSALRNNAQPAVGGVGILLNPAAEKVLSECHTYI